MDYRGFDQAQSQKYKSPPAKSKFIRKIKRPDPDASVYITFKFYLKNYIGVISIPFFLPKFNFNLPPVQSPKTSHNGTKKR